MKEIDQGIFLHRSSFSSSSLITTYFTRKKGLQKFVFRGGKKKASSLFPLAFSELEFYGRNSDLLNLTNTQVIFPQTIQFQPIHSSVAFFMAEIIQKCVEAGDPDEKLFCFLEQKIQELETIKDLQIIPVEFLAELSYFLGFAPLIEEENASVFNLDAGVFQHTKSESQRCFSGDAIQLILSILKEDALQNKYTKNTREEALVILLNYYSIHVPRFKKLESYDVLKEVLA